MSDCLTWDRRAQQGTVSKGAVLKGQKESPALGPAKPRTHVCRAALGWQLQGAQEEAKTAGQQLAAQALVRPTPMCFEVWLSKGPPCRT